jgi:hypothetical protein
MRLIPLISTVAVRHRVQRRVRGDDLQQDRRDRGSRLAPRRRERRHRGTVVIAKGTAVKGIVAAVEKAGRMGKGGKLNLHIESATAVDGQRVALRATKAKEGDDKTGSTVALTVLFGPIGLLTKGKDATYPEGTRVTVHTDQAVTVTPTVASVTP